MCVCVCQCVEVWVCVCGYTWCKWSICGNAVYVWVLAWRIWSVCGNARVCGGLTWCKWSVCVGTIVGVSRWMQVYVMGYEIKGVSIKLYKHSFSVNYALTNFGSMYRFVVIIFYERTVG